MPLRIKIVGQEGLRECVEGCPGFSGRFVQAIHSIEEVRLTQQRQASGQFINLLFAATYGKADILKIRFGRSGHLFYEFFINIAALGLFCEVYDRQVFVVRGE